MISQRQMRFAKEYMLDFDKARAAKAAGYSPKNAEYRASKLLEQADVKKYIEDNSTALEKVNGERVLKELERIAFLNAADYSRIRTMKDENGKTYQKLEFIDTEDLSADVRAGIISIKETKDGLSIATADKFRALELLGKHFGLFSEKSEATMQLNITAEDRALLERVANRNAGDN